MFLSAEEERLMIIRDMKNCLDTAYAEGEAKGRIDGRNETTLEIALKLKENGYDNSTIAKLTDLSEQEIDNLK